MQYAAHYDSNFAEVAFDGRRNQTSFNLCNLLIKGICFYDVRTDLLTLLCFNDNLANLR